MLVGFHVHVEPPSSLTIAAALRNAFAPKTYMLERWPEIGRSWNVWGLPNLVIMDNALENKARFLTEALSELGVRWLFAEPRTPEDKPFAERVIGTLARSFSPAVPGGTGASPRERGDYDTAGMACMTLVDIDELLHRWVVNYNATFHQTIRAIPEQRWLELGDGEAAPFEDILMLDALLGDFAERTLTRKGVYLLGLRYGDRGSHRPLESLLARRGHEGHLRIRVRFDRTDLSFIWVQDPDTKEYRKVPSLDPDYTDRLSLARHRVIRARAVEKARGYVSIADLCRARDNLQRRIDELAGGAASTMTDRKFAAIWTGLGAKGSWNDIFRLTEDEYGPTKKDARSIVDLFGRGAAQSVPGRGTRPEGDGGRDPGDRVARRVEQGGCVMSYLDSLPFPPRPDESARGLLLRVGEPGTRVMGPADLPHVCRPEPEGVGDRRLEGVLRHGRGERRRDGSHRAAEADCLGIAARSPKMACVVATSTSSRGRLRIREASSSDRRTAFEMAAIGSWWPSTSTRPGSGRSVNRQARVIRTEWGHLISPSGPFSAAAYVLGGSASRLSTWFRPNSANPSSLPRSCSATSGPWVPTCTMTTPGRDFLSRVAKLPGWLNEMTGQPTGSNRQNRLMNTCTAGNPHPVIREET